MFNKYIDIPYKHNSSDFLGCDCYGLIKLIYKEERNILLPSYIYNEDWYKKNENHIVNNISKGFYKVEWPYKLYDGLIFFHGSNFIASHIGLWIGDNKLIHIYEDSSSMITKFDGYAKSKLYCAVRYRGIETE